MSKALVASINGVSVKKLNFFIGNEGGCFQGDVYLDGKKLGFWSQDFWGGPDNFEFDATPIKERAKEYYSSHPDVDTIRLYNMSIDNIDFNNLPVRSVDDMFEIESNLMNDLADLTETLKWYKKWNKQGLSVLGKLTFIYGKWPIPKQNGTMCGGMTKEDIAKRFKGFTNKYPYARVEYYEKPEDFIKTV